MPRVGIMMTSMKGNNIKIKSKKQITEQDQNHSSKNQMSLRKPKKWQLEDLTVGKKKLRGDYLKTTRPSHT